MEPKKAAVRGRVAVAPAGVEDLVSFAVEMDRTAVFGR
jgi:hypothetical protein